MKKVECIVVIVAFVCVACGGSSSQPNVQFDLEKLKSEGYTLVTCDGEGTVDVKCKRCFGLGKLKKKIK
jgi:DnaJ-class molecular chaperone